MTSLSLHHSTATAPLPLHEGLGRACVQNANGRSALPRIRRVRRSLWRRQGTVILVQALDFFIKAKWRVQQCTQNTAFLFYFLGSFFFRACWHVSACAFKLFIAHFCLSISCSSSSRRWPIKRSAMTGALPNKPTTMQWKTTTTKAAKAAAGRYMRLTCKSTFPALILFLFHAYRVFFFAFTIPLFGLPSACFSSCCCTSHFLPSCSPLHGHPHSLSSSSPLCIGRPTAPSADCAVVRPARHRQDHSGTCSGAARGLRAARDQRLGRPVGRSAPGR